MGRGRTTKVADSVALGAAIERFVVVSERVDNEHIDDERVNNEQQPYLFAHTHERESAAERESPAKRPSATGRRTPTRSNDSPTATSRHA